ncbi:MAG: PLP-dependent aminotransferase family protein, partial [Paenibacillus sp.]|nr:PLP-dependent aminotransferase family protein [Paenibacillus sp.]
MWKPDRSSKKPIYQQITDDMERRISYGEFPPGSSLPSERKLADQLGVNRSTVVQAYEELRASGLVESSKGSGTRVSKHKWGITPKQTPNWKQYVEGGTFLPNLPFIRRIREELRKGDSLIDFASGELSPDLFPNQIIRELLQKQPFQEQLGYEDPQGFSPLRESLVTFLERHLHIHTTDSSILITSGSQQSLYLITQCLLSPGDAVAIEDPSYCYSLPMFQSAGLRLFRLPVDEHGIDPGDIISLYRQHRIR